MDYRRNMQQSTLFSEVGSYSVEQIEIEVKSNRIVGLRLSYRGANQGRWYRSTIYETEYNSLILEEDQMIVGFDANFENGYLSGLRFHVYTQAISPWVYVDVVTLINLVVFVRVVGI